MHVDQHPFFKGLRSCQIEKGIKILHGRIVHIEKGTILFAANEVHRHAALVLEGKLRVCFYQPEGDAVFLYHLLPGETAGEESMFARLPFRTETSAVTPCELLIIESIMPAFIGTCLQFELYRRLRLELTGNNAKILDKLHHISHSSLSEKIMSYLRDCQLQSGEWFCIDLDRAEMASYLNCDRSALSKELGKLKNAGMIDYRKNHFRILIQEGRE